MTNKMDKVTTKLNVIQLFIFLLFLLNTVFADNIKSLNLQYHYDFKREHPTATLEYYGTDKLGYWFFFSDINFDHNLKKGGASDFYFEIMRYFQLTKINEINVTATIQYNDGNFPIEYAWLVGFNFNNISIGPLDISTDLLLKKNYKLNVDWQWTVVWYSELLNHKLVFNGYFDFWKNDNTNSHWPDFSPEVRKTKYSFQWEPQIGWQITPQWKIGSEWEISRGFLGSTTGELAKKESYEYNKWYFLPTLFIQFNF
jgi:hypothetical protein